MYEELPLEALVPHPQNANRMSRMFSKKLRYNIQQVGLYETITVRPHPAEHGKFEVLNGHARLEVLRAIGRETAKCDIWNVDDANACMFLAILNKLRGSDVPELRMSLLFNLLRVRNKDELTACLPETAVYLRKIEQLPEGVAEFEKKSAVMPDVVVIKFYMNSENHAVVLEALNKVMEDYRLSDSSEALVQLARIYLQSEDPDSNLMQSTMDFMKTQAAVSPL